MTSSMWLDADIKCPRSNLRSKKQVDVGDTQLVSRFRPPTVSLCWSSSRVDCGPGSAGMDSLH